MQWGSEEPLRATDIPHGNVTYEFSELVVVPGPTSVTINNGALDLATTLPFGWGR